VDPVDSTPVSSGSEPTGQPAGQDESGKPKGPLKEAANTAHRIWDWFKDKLHEIWGKVSGSQEQSG